MLQQYDGLIDRKQMKQLPIPFNTDREFLKALVHTEELQLSEQDNLTRSCK
jgi:hypothetical protein